MEKNKNYEKYFTLAEAIKTYPELFKDERFSEYGFAAESIFEMIAKKFKEKLGLIAERNNKENIYVVDFKIKNPKTDKIICYCDIEGDGTTAFKDDGTFIWWRLTIPIEKKKYFYKDKPFFYIKYSSNFKWCYVIDGWASRNLFEPVTKKRQGIPRGLWEASSSAIFNRKEPYGIHRCPVQDWFKAVVFFMNKRYHSYKF